MRPILLLLLATIVVCLGCASPGQIQPEDWRGIVANAVVNTAWVQVESGEQPGPGPAPRPTPGKTCPQCLGTGKVGDGRVFQKCLMCDGTGKITQSLPVSGAGRQADQIATAIIDSPARSPVLCKCPDCGCENCACVDGECRCPECLPEYETAYRRAKAELCGLLVCCGECSATEGRLLAEQRGLIACRCWPSCENSPGFHAYLWSSKGRLLLADSQPIARLKQVKGGHMECGPGGCRFVPDQLSPGANWDSFSGGSCASGNCGSTRRRWGR